MIVQIEITEQDAIDINNTINVMFAATEYISESKSDDAEVLNESIDVGCMWLKRLIDNRT